MNNMAHWVFIAWAPYSRRSETFSQAFGAKLYLIHYLKFQSPLYAPFKYILQAIRALQVLFKDRPKVIFVQNPPFLNGLVAYLYCCVANAQYVLDHHSAAFAHIWDWALPVQRFLARYAAVNLVTNQHWAQVVNSWGARAFVIKDPFVELPKGETFKVDPKIFNVIVINTFAPDEPLDDVLDAASKLPQVKFYITGNKSRKTPDYFVNLPPNVCFTGFLPDGQYLGLFRAVDAAVALTTRDHTLQRGGCEAVALGKPLITSDWLFLQEFFPKGTIHVDNSVDSICDGIAAMQRKYKDLEEEMINFRDESRRKWHAQFAQLREFLE